MATRDYSAYRAKWDEEKKAREEKMSNPDRYEEDQVSLETEPAPVQQEKPQESWYTRADRGLGGLLPFGAPVAPPEPLQGTPTTISLPDMPDVSEYEAQAPAGNPLTQALRNIFGSQVDSFDERSRQLKQDNPILRKLALLEQSNPSYRLIETVTGPNPTRVEPTSGFEQGIEKVGGFIQDTVLGGKLLKAIAPAVGGGVKKALDLAKGIPDPLKITAGAGATIGGAQAIIGATNPEMKDASTFTKAGASFRAGIGDVLTTAGSAAEWQGWDDLGQSLGDAGQSIKEGYEIHPEEFSWRSFFKPDFYAVNVTRALPLTLSLLPAMYAGYKLGGAAGGKLGLSPFKKAILSSITGAGTSRPLESAMEAGSTYEEAIARGMDRDKAEEAANSVFKKNLALVGLDAVQLAAAFAPTPFKPVSKLGKAALGAGRIGGNALAEAGEEAWQEVFQRQAMGDPIAFDARMQESMAIGGIFGAGMGGGGAAVDTLRTIQERTIQNLPSDMQTQVQNHIEQQVRSGVDPVEAIEKALDAVAETEEGKAVIDQAVQEVSEEMNRKVMSRDAAREKYGPLKQKPAATIQAQPVADKIVYGPQGQRLEVIDDTDPSLLTVRNEAGTEFKIGRRAVKEAPPVTAPETAIAPPQVTQESVAPIPVPEVVSTPQEGTGEAVKPAPPQKKDTRTDEELIQAVIEKVKAQGYGADKITVPFVVHAARLLDARRAMDIADKVESAMQEPAREAPQGGVEAPVVSVQAGEEMPPQKAKEPWQMTREEWSRPAISEPDAGELIQTDAHKNPLAVSIKQAHDTVMKKLMEKSDLKERPDQALLIKEVADEWGRAQGLKPMQARKQFRDAVKKMMEEGTAGDFTFGNVRDEKNSLGRIKVGGRDVQLGTIQVRKAKPITTVTEKPQQTQSNEPKTYQEAQDTIDNYERSLIEKYGEYEVLAAPIFERTGTFKDIPPGMNTITGQETKLTNDELGQLKEMYRQRDELGANEDKAVLDSTISRMPKGGPATPDMVKEALQELMKSKQLSDAFGHTEPDNLQEIVGKIYTSLSHKLASKGELPEDFAGNLDLALSVAKNFHASDYGKNPEPLLRQVREIVDALFGTGTSEKTELHKLLGEGKPSPETEQPEAPTQKDPVVDTSRQKPPSQKPESEIQSKQEPHVKVADFVDTKLSNKEFFTSDQLFKAADEAHGGTQAQGKYTPKDAYDAMELGINKYLLRHKKSVGPTVTGSMAKRNIESIQSEILVKIPTQTKRTSEQDEFQQFSTPPNLAYVAAWAANIHPGETVLEPSAGVGGIATFAKTAGAKVVVNELSPRRAELLKELNFDQVFTENAEQINNILPADVKPTVVLMNPPFSSTAGRMQGARDTKNAEAHIEQALKRLQPGGRLVAIVGKGMADSAPSFKAWWNKLREEYNIRANIGIDGNNYAKYGTTFDVQIVVIDKTGPGAETVTGKVGTLEEALQLLEGIKNDRRSTEQATPKYDGKDVPQKGQAEAGPVEPVPVPTDRMGTGNRGSESGGRDKQPRDRGPSGTDTKTNVQPEPGKGTELPDQGRTGPGRPEGNVGEAASVGQTEDTGGRGGVPNRQTEGGTPGERTTGSESGVTVESEEVQGREGDLTDAVFTEYAPQRLKIPGAKQHPGNLAQSAAMAAVGPPVPTYTPNLPKEVIEKGKLSIAQLEAVVYAGQAHQQTLPNGQRKGFFIGDGTGVGKGREISGIILDNMRHGRKKTVWVSKNSPLFGDARRDFGDIGGDPNLVFDFSKIKTGTPVQNKEGILFTTYNTMGQGLEVSSSEREGTSAVVAKPGQKTRIDQLVQWLGEDFDGVIAFDEAHHMQNSLAMKGKRGMTKPSNMALAGVELQKRLPNARVVYVSATGATEVSNLAYADRLGLWGKGTPFANKRDFVSKIQAGGLAAMELVARDMKAMGVYIARSLGFDGVTYGTTEHQLTPEQVEIYDEMAKAWQIVLQNVNEAMEETGQKSDGNTKGRALAKFWGAQQRFFSQVLTSMQMPSVIKQVKEDLKNKNAIVMQLVNTNEATLNRQLAKMQDDDSFEDIDLTPRDMLMQYLDKSFPTQQFEEYTDENGNTRSRPVVDSRGNPVQNQQAVAMKERLMAKLGAMKVPEGPLEIVLNAFGVENVAEVTGRTRRIVKIKDESGRLKATPETRTPKHVAADATAFMEGKKKILVFSDAGGTGRSYHASLTAKNQLHRVHYLIQAGWRADSAVQGFGRTHRTNQKSAPHYVLVTTSLKGQKRFISSIARRLDQLGALTKGQRQTGSQGLFSAKDNLESELAKDALQRFYEDLTGNQIPSLDAKDLLRKMGLDKLADDNMNLKEVPEARDITKFLNRILSLESSLQNKVFDVFSDRLDQLVERAIANGTLDVGLENFRADKVKVVDEKTVFTDEKSAAETKYVELEASFKERPRTYKEAVGLTDFIGFYQNTKSGRVYAFRKWRDSTLESGAVVKTFRVYGQANGSVNNINEVQFKKGNWKELSREGAQSLWNDAIKALPEYNKEKVHLITGAILPIWDRLPSGRVRVVRVKTDDGKIMLGRIVPEVAIDTTLRNLGASRGKQELSPQQVVDKVLNDGYAAYLANDWRITRRRVSNENRIEVNGQDLYKFMDELKEEGVFIERIQWETRFFIPTGKDAASVMEKVTKYRPVIDLVAPAGKQQKATDDTFSMPSSLRKKVDKILENRITDSDKGTFSLASRHSPQKTSINQVAAGLRTAATKGIFKEGMIVADVGGGLWEKGTEYLAEKGVTNLVYDPYARSPEHNEGVLKRLEENGGADAASLNNVLNVIPTDEERADVLKFLYQLLKPGGQAVISVYEGNKSGKGARREFSDGTSTWQGNRSYSTYEEGIKAALPGATVEKKFGMFVVTKPAKNIKEDDTFYMARSGNRPAPQPTPSPPSPPPPPVQINPQDPSRLSPKAAREIADILGTSLDTVIRGAKLGKAGRKSLGFFKRSEMAGRVKRRFLESWRVTGHELGHAFHFRAGFKPNQREMKAIVQQFYPGGQAPQGKQTAEGLAEFIMLWFADNAAARQMAPRTASRLEGFLDANPVLQEAFARAKVIADEDLAGTEMERMRKLTINRGIRHAPNVGAEYEVPWWKRPLFWFVDYTLPLKELYRAAVKEGFTGLDPAKLAAISGMAREQAVDMFKNQARDKAGRFLLPGRRSLQEIAEEAAAVENGMILFNDIYKAMRYLERWNRMEARGEKDIALPQPKDFFQKVVDEANTNYPQLVQLVEEYSEILSEINLRLLVRGGVISEEAADRVRAGSKIYFPLYTVGRGLDVESSQRRSSGPGVRYFRGHSGQTLDIIEATIMRTTDSILAVEINRLMKHIRLALENENMGVFGTIEDKPEVVKAISMGRLKGQIDDFLNSELDPDDEGRVVSLFLAGGISEVSKNEPILMARYGDQSVYMRVAPDLYKSVLSMKPVTFDFLAKVLSKLAMVSRIGALANIRYVSNAVMRDWIGSKIQSQTPERNVALGLIKGALVASGRAENAEEIMSLYIQSGAFGSSVQEVLDSLGRSVNSDGLISTPAPGWKRTAINTFVRVVRSPLDALRIIEEAPRIPEFQEVMRRGLEELNLTLDDLRQGNIPDAVAEDVEKLLTEAAYASREVLVNFGLHGVNESFRKYARTVPFLQGGVQGIYREMRQVKEKTGATMVSWLKYVLPLTLICWALNYRDDRYRDMPSTSRDLYWWFPVSGSFQVAVAKPYFYSIGANLLERFLDWGINQDDPNTRKPFEDIRGLVDKTFVPPMTSMLVDTILALYSNKDFMGSPIEPQREEKFSNAMKYGPGNSETAIKLARMYAALMGENGPSPRQIDYFAKGIFGGVGKTALALTDKLIPGENPGGRKVGAEYAPLIGGLLYGPGERGSRITERFYKDYDRAQKLYNDAKSKAGVKGDKEGDTAKMLEAVSPEDRKYVQAIPAMRAIADDMAELRKELRELNIKPDETAERKRQAGLRYNWMSKVAAGYLYGQPIPAAPPELEITEAQAQDVLEYYDHLTQKAMTNAAKKPGGPI